MLMALHLHMVFINISQLAFNNSRQMVLNNSRQMVLRHPALVAKALMITWPSGVKVVVCASQMITRSFLAMLVMLRLHMPRSSSLMLMAKRKARARTRMLARVGGRTKLHQLCTLQLQIPIQNLRICRPGIKLRLQRRGVFSLEVVFLSLSVHVILLGTSQAQQKHFSIAEIRKLSMSFHNLKSPRSVCSRCNGKALSCQ